MINSLCSVGLGDRSAGPTSSILAKRNCADASQSKRAQTERLQEALGSLNRPDGLINFGHGRSFPHISTKCTAQLSGKGGNARLTIGSLMLHPFRIRTRPDYGIQNAWERIDARHSHWKNFGSWF